MAFLKFVSVFLAMCVLVAAWPARGTSVCPEPEMINPCNCKIVAYGLHVVCSGFTSSQQLRDKFQRFASLHVDNLLLYGLNFTKGVPEDFFQGMTVYVLQVEMSRMRFAGAAFRGLENSLKQLNVMGCLSSGPEIKIAQMTKLQDFHFRKNKLHKVSSNWLKGSMPNLHVLNLDNNDIATVEAEAFSSLHELKEVSLADNRISTVARNMFPEPAPKLMRIDLSHNELSSLPIDIFTEMPNLATVVLSGNNLRSIPEETWSKIWSQVNAVLLYENSIVCDERIDWIKKRKKPKKLEGTCAEPVAVMGKPIMKVLEK